MKPSSADIAGSELAIDELLARVEHDRELLLELLDIFKKHSPRQLALLREAVKRMDAGKVASEAHKLKGSLSNLAARPAAAAAARLEQLAREGKTVEFAVALAALEEQVCRLMPEIAACLQGARW